MESARSSRFLLEERINRIAQQYQGKEKTDREREIKIDAETVHLVNKINKR